MTVETVKALRTCDILFSLHGNPDINRALKRLCGRVVDLTRLYRDKKLDLAVYERIVYAVAARLTSNRTIGVIFHGHPLLYSNPAQMLIRHCERKRIPCEILTGVSSLDAIFTTLRIDIGKTGLQIFDVNRMLLYRLRPDIRTPCLLFQLGSFGSALISRTLLNAKGRFHDLERYLGRWYPATHPAQIIECSTVTGISDSLIMTTISKIDRNGGRINYNSTLFIPACSSGPERMDARFASRLKAPERLARLVAPGLSWAQPRHE